MTKKEAVENHRKMWRWIAEETLKRKRKVFKGEYLLQLYDNQLIYEDITNECFCCEYVSQFIYDVCDRCPITWPGGCCNGENGLYEKFTYANSLEQCAKIARIISELPERETTVFDIVEDDQRD